MKARIQFVTALVILLALALAPASAGAAPAHSPGVRPSQQAACSNPQTLVSAGGVDDDFALAPMPELAAPDAALTAYMTGIWGASVNPFFDRPFADRAFGHTFQIAQLANLRVLSATLTMRASAFAGRTSNDSIGFFQPVVGGGMTSVWGATLASLSGTNWSVGTEALLAINLPQPVLDAIADGELDVIVEDDTTVDFMRLNVVVCWCLPGFTLQGGINDNFAPPTEPRELSLGLNVWLQSRGVLGIRDFDQSEADFWFGHTFSSVYPAGEPRPICGASLEIHVRPDVTGYPNNDTLALTFVDPISGADLVSPAPSWWAYFGVIGSPSLGLGSWATGSPGAVINLDLAALPNGGTGLLPQIMQFGQLDVVIQDDTAVDYVTLTITE